MGDSNIVSHANFRGNFPSTQANREFEHWQKNNPIEIVSVNETYDKWRGETNISVYYRGSVNSWSRIRLAWEKDGCMCAKCQQICLKYEENHKT